jgi:hypothetical protein
MVKEQAKCNFYSPLVSFIQYLMLETAAYFLTALYFKTEGQMLLREKSYKAIKQ